MPRTKSIAELEKEIRTKQVRVEKLRRRRDRVASVLEDLNRQIFVLAGEVPPARKAGKRAGGRRGAKRVKAVRRGRRRRGSLKAVGGKPLIALLVDALGKSDGSMRARDLADAVIKAGYKTRDRNFRQTVASTLAGDKRFHRISRGVYKLAKG